MDKNLQKKLRKNRTSKTVRALSDRPRLVVFKSSKHISAQIIDDEKSVTLVSATDAGVKGKPMEIATEVGKTLGKKALEAKIKKIVFDRRGFKYHGRVKALADGAREVGLEF